MKNGLKNGIQGNGSENTNSDAGSDSKYTTWYECKQCKYFTTDLTAIQQHTRYDHRCENDIGNISFVKPTSTILKDLVRKLPTRRKQMRSIPLITKHETYYAPNKLKSTGQHKNVIDMWFKCKQCTHFVPDVFALRQHMRHTHKLFCWSDVVNDILVHLQIKKCVFENDELTFAKGASKITLKSAGKCKKVENITELQRVSGDNFNVTPEPGTKATMRNAENNKSGGESDDNDADNNSNKDDDDDDYIPPADSDNDSNDNISEVVKNQDNYIKQGAKCQVAPVKGHVEEQPAKSEYEEDGDSKRLCSDVYTKKTYKQANKAHKEGGHVCSECGNRFADLRGLNDHKWRRHSGMNPKYRKLIDKSSVYQCPSCPKTYTVHESFRQHIRHKHGCAVNRQRPSHPCTLCDFVAPRKDNLQVHMNGVHLDFKPFVCEVCAKAFSNLHNLQDHIERQHSVNGPEKKFTCETCGKKFFSKCNMVSHSKRHDKDSIRVVCELCGKSLSCVRSLQIHIEQYHERKKNYKCPLCPYQCYQKSHMDEHEVAKHSKATKYRCEVCFLFFSTLFRLNQHLHGVHKEYMLQTGNDKATSICPVCGKSFFAASQLRRHMKKVHKISPTTATSTIITPTPTSANKISPTTATSTIITSTSTSATAAANLQPHVVDTSEVELALHPVSQGISTQPHANLTLPPLFSTEF